MQLEESLELDPLGNPYHTIVVRSDPRPGSALVRGTRRPSLHTHTVEEPVPSLTAVVVVVDGDACDPDIVSAVRFVLDTADVDVAGGAAVAGAGAAAVELVEATAEDGAAEADAAEEDAAVCLGGALGYIMNP